jgi:hypothetical protein
MSTGKRKSEKKKESKPKRKGKSKLHTRGYQVYRHAVSIGADVLEQLELQSGQGVPIFNDLDEVDDDGLRTQFRPKKINGLINEVKGFLEQTPHLGKLKANAWVVIESKPGCADQPAHCDYPPHGLQGLEDDEVPLSVLVALTPGARLHVWPNSIHLITDPNKAKGIAPIARQTLELNVGDLVLFRADLAHAGGAYEQGNMRLFCYLDSPALKRSRNQSWLIHAIDAQPDVAAAIKPN